MDKKPLWLNEDLLSNWAKDYCVYKKDDPLVRKFITTGSSSCLYCKNDRYNNAAECIAIGGHKNCEWWKNNG